MSGVMHRVLRALAGLAIGFVVLLLTVWGALALWHQMPGPSVVRWFVIAMWSTLGVTVVLSRAGLLGRRNRNIAGFAFVIAAASLLMWWGTLQPSHQRVWADDVAQLLEALMARSNSPTLGHPKFPQAGPPDYDDSGATAMRAAASLRR